MRTLLHHEKVKIIGKIYQADQRLIVFLELSLIGPDIVIRPIRHSLISLLALQVMLSSEIYSRLWLAKVKYIVSKILSCLA